GAIFVDVAPLAKIPRLANISTRGLVESGEGVMIGGFVIGGSAPKRVIVRAIGPSLAAYGVQDVLPNPQILLLRADHSVVASNDDCHTASNADESDRSGFAPADFREASILTTLDPGAYTAIVSGS